MSYKVKERLIEYYGGNIECSIKKLAGNNPITIDKKAIDYDTIASRESRGTVTISSSDALLFEKGWMNFVEFKTGCYSRESIPANDEKLFQEILQLRIRLKAYEALSLFEKVVFPKLVLDVSVENIKKRFVAVIDAKENVVNVLEDTLAELSGINVENSFKKAMQKWLDNTLAVYRREIDGKQLFYQDTKVLYSFEFDQFFGQ